MKKIVVIGGGNMGFTYAEGIFNAEIAEIEIVEKNAARVTEISALNKMNVTDNYAVIQKADIIFLAVKPLKSLINPEGSSLLDLKIKCT